MKIIDNNHVAKGHIMSRQEQNKKDAKQMKSRIRSFRLSSSINEDVTEPELMCYGKRPHTHIHLFEREGGK